MYPMKVLRMTPSVKIKRENSAKKSPDLHSQIGAVRNERIVINR